MHFSRSLFKLANHIEYYSKFQPTSFTLKSLIDFGLFEIFTNKRVYSTSFVARDGDIKQSYKYLRVELLIRWSHMRKEIDYLPPK